MSTSSSVRCSQPVGKRYVGTTAMAVMFALSPTTPALAYKIGSPSNTEQVKQEVKRQFGASSLVDTLFDRFGHTVHESILARSYGCNTLECDSLPKSVLRGLLWADIPSGFPVRGRAEKVCKGVRVGLQIDGKLSHPICTFGYIIDGAKISQRTRHRGKRGEFHSDGYLTLYRTHYGDMQWMHAMAESLHEPAEVTRSSMLAWSEYLYRIATRNEVEQIDLSQPLSRIPQVAKWFSNKKSGWNSRDLFATGQHGVDEQIIRDMAFGALLHVLQDSYSESHVRRDFSDSSSKSAGQITQFLTYPAQDAECHSPADAAPFDESSDWWNSATGAMVIAQGAELIALRSRSAPTEEVIEWLKNSAFPLDENARPAEGGFDSKCRPR